MMTDIVAAKEQVHTNSKKMTVTRKASITEDDVKFTDSDCEGILEEIDTPRSKSRKEKRNKSADKYGSMQRNIGISHGGGVEQVDSVSAKESNVVTKAELEIVSLNHNVNGNRSAFSAIPKNGRVSHTEISATAQDLTNKEHAVNRQTGSDVIPVELGDSDVTTKSRTLPKLTANGKPEILRHSETDREDDVINGDVCNNEIITCSVDNETVQHERGEKENYIEVIPQVKLDLSRLVASDVSDGFRRHRRSSTASSSNSSVKDQSSQTILDVTDTIHQLPISPRVSPLTSARYSPRRVSSAELHTAHNYGLQPFVVDMHALDRAGTPEQMVKQADRLIERTQVLMQRSAEAKRRTENLLKSSRERRAQERLSELASYEGPQKTNDEMKENYRTLSPLSDTNGNHLDDT